MFMRPSTPEVHTQRDAVAGTCPACQAQSLQRYRVLSEGGWWNVVKCSQCLTSVSREPGPLLGPLTTALHALLPARAARK